MTVRATPSQRSMAIGRHLVDGRCAPGTRARPLLGLALALAVSLAAEAQPRPSVGFLSANSAQAMSARIDAFRLGLRELGYVEQSSLVGSVAYIGGINFSDHNFAWHDLMLRIAPMVLCACARVL